MDLITGGPPLDTLLTQLMHQHTHIAFAVAWATIGTTSYATLLEHRGKIKCGVIGTHFYQTHPDVLDDFADSKHVQFVLQPSGVFHPKVFLFWSGRKWDLLIGSANLTAGALTRNSELMIHITSDDAPPDVKNDVWNQIKEYLALGKTVTEADAATYRALHKIQRKNLMHVSGEYSDGSKRVSPLDSNIMMLSWPDFFQAVKADPHHGFEERCELLASIRAAFEQYEHFSSMPLTLRQTIAGVPNTLNPRWGWFGSMKGAGKFRNALNRNDQYLSLALDRIPVDGAVTRDNYIQYIDTFIKAFPAGRDGIGVASRLLAMKRPDWFVCLDARNRIGMSKDFGIKQSDITYERYWDDIVNRITDSVWWNAPQPGDSLEAEVWRGRAAMLDAIFYQP